MDNQVFVRQSLERFVSEAPSNMLSAHGGARIYDEPLVAFADAADTTFALIKEPGVVGPHHRSPAEWLPGARTVVSYFLPFSEFVRASNRIEGLPSEEWVSARIDGEVFNNAVRDFLVEVLKSLGGDAMSPVRSPEFAIKHRRANWSERHVAYVTGLGTFGLSRSLITDKGTAGRYGSAITTVEITPTPRNTSTIHDACPFLVSGACGVCIERCPAKAITANGKNTDICEEYIDTVVRPKYAPRYGCAKCQTNVPCEARRP